MRDLRKALMVGLTPLVLSLGAFAPANPHARAATSAPAPKALLVIAFGPNESLRGNALPDLQSTVQKLWEYGFEVSILDAYNEKGDIAECPHYELHQHLDNNCYNLVVYYGHGNAELSLHGNPSQVALELLSDQPIVAERAMYFNMDRGGGGREPIRGGHVSPGVRDASPEWYFAEAYTGN